MATLHCSFEEILNIVPNPRRLVSQPSVACRDNLVVTGGPIRLLQLVINIHAVCGTERPSDRSSVSCMTIYFGKISQKSCHQTVLNTTWNEKCRLIRMLVFIATIKIKNMEIQFFIVAIKIWYVGNWFFIATIKKWTWKTKFLSPR